MGKRRIFRKIRIHLDNNEKYEIYRDFNKKNPKIYNENSEDISKEFNILYMKAFLKDISV